MKSLKNHSAHSFIASLSLVAFLLSCSGNNQKNSATPAPVTTQEEKTDSQTAGCPIVPSVDGTSDHISESPQTCEQREQDPFAELLGLPPIDQPEKMTDEEILQVMRELQDGTRTISEYEKNLILSAVLRAAREVSQAKDVYNLQLDLLAKAEANENGYTLRGEVASAFAILSVGLHQLPFQDSMTRKAFDWLTRDLNKKGAMRISTELASKHTASTLQHALASSEAAIAKLLTEGPEGIRAAAGMSMAVQDANVLRAAQNKFKTKAIKAVRIVIIAGAAAAAIYAGEEFYQAEMTRDQKESAELNLQAQIGVVSRNEKALKRLQDFFENIKAIPSDSSQSQAGKEKLEEVTEVTQDQ